MTGLSIRWLAETPPCVRGRQGCSLSGRDSYKAESRGFWATAYQSPASDGFDAHRLRSLLALLDLKSNALAFVQRPETTPEN
jgi:hypothetical protein